MKNGRQSLNLGQAQGEDLPFGALLVGDTPSEIDVGPSDEAFLVRRPELEKRALEELVTLRGHVAESRRDKDPNRSLFDLELSRHGSEPGSYCARTAKKVCPSAGLSPLKQMAEHRSSFALGANSVSISANIALL